MPIWKTKNFLFLTALSTIFLTVLITVGFVLFHQSNNDKDKSPEPKQQKSRVEELKPTTNLPIAKQNGDLAIDKGVTEIVGKKWVVKGTVTVKGNGKLVIKNSDILVDLEYNSQFTLDVVGNGELVLENVKIFTTEQRWVNWNYAQNAKATFKNVKQYDNTNPWHTAGGNSKLTIENSKLGLSLGNNSSVQTTDSSMFFELLLEDAKGEFVLPRGKTTDYSLNVPVADGEINIKAKNTTISEWGTTLNFGNSITFTNSELTVGMNSGTSPGGPNNPKIKLSGLKAKTYEDFSLEFDSNKLRLKNTKVTSWYPQALGKSLVEIEDSDLADIQWSGHSAKMIIRDSTASIAIARDNVILEFHNSKLSGDVTARDNGKIYLYNSEVEGQINEVDNGQVIVREE